MAFLDTTVAEFEFNMGQLEKKYFGTQFYNFAINNTLIGLAKTLTKVLNYYKTLHKAAPYDNRTFYVHALAYINSAMQSTTENRIAMDTVFVNLEKLLDLAEALQYAPSLEEWEPEE